MPRKSRAAREVQMERITSQLDRVVGSKHCIAVQLRDVDGTPAMLLMGDSCPACREFRAAMPGRPVAPPPSSVSTDDTDTTDDILED
jgi:hypothetical protein